MQARRLQRTRRTPGVQLGPNLLVGKLFTTNAGSVETQPINYMTDQNSETRWISTPMSPAYADVDLGQEYRLSRVSIVWAGDTTKDYTLQTSNDGTSWTTVAAGSTTNTVRETITHNFSGDTAIGRYLRINFLSMWDATYGNSIFEVMAYGEPTAVPIQLQTFTPAVRAFSTTELVNPLRGLSYGGDEHSGWNILNPTTNRFPSNGTIFPDNSDKNRAAYGTYPGSRDSNFRINWRNLEPTQGNYNWAPIDNILSNIGGRRLTLRVMVLSSGGSNVSGVSGKLTVMPDWVENVSGATEQLTIDGGTDTYVVPKWDSAVFLTLWKNFLTALGNRYDRDERLAVFELSGLGDWGEWHVYTFRNHYNGYDRPWTSATVNTVVDANAAAFPNTQMVCFTAEERATWRAMNTPVPTVKPIGIRNDGFGDANWYHGLPRMLGPISNQGPQMASDRWKTAPMLFEYATMTTLALSQEGLLLGRQQTQQYHGTTIRTSNLFYLFPQGWGSTMSADEWDNFTMTQKYCGYRYHVSEVSLPVSVARGGVMDFTPKWVNMGTAPTYENWQIVYALKPAGQPTAADTATSTSLLNLKTVFYDGDQYQGNTANPKTDPIPSAPVASAESLQIPAGIQPGAYDLYVSVKWNEHKAGATTTVEFPPMNLAMNNRTTTTGQYPIGSVTIT